MCQDDFGCAHAAKLTRQEVKRDALRIRYAFWHPETSQTSVPHVRAEDVAVLNRGRELEGERFAVAVCLQELLEQVITQLGAFGGAHAAIGVQVFVRQPQQVFGYRDGVGIAVEIARCAQCQAPLL